MRKLSLFMDISQNSTLKKWTLHKIHYQKKRLFIIFKMRISDHSQYSISEKQTFHKDQYTGKKVSLPLSLPIRGVNFLEINFRLEYRHSLI